MNQRLLAETTTSAYQDFFFIAAVAAVLGTLPALPWDRFFDWLRAGWNQTTPPATQTNTTPLPSSQPVRDNAAD